MNENEEIWRDIEGYDGMYQVSKCTENKDIQYFKIIYFVCDDSETK